MRRRITLLLYILSVLVLVFSFSCSFQTQKIDASITIPNNALKKSRSFIPDAEYYLEYILSGGANAFDKIKLTSDQVESKQDITFEINDIPLGKNIKIVIKLVEYTTNAEGGKESKVVYQGVAETILTTEKDIIEIEIQPEEDPVIPETSLEVETITNSFIFNVGDLILTNGKVIKYDDAANFDDYAAYVDNAVAVIFRATNNGEEALGVGVKQTYCNWVKNRDVAAYSKHFEGLSDHTDGSTTWNTICSADSTASSSMEDYEIFNFAENYPYVYYEFEDDILTKKTRINYLASDPYKDDWYIPTYTECNTLFINLDKVNSVLNALGAIKPEPKYTAFYDNSVQLVSSEWYWTANTDSAENALFYDFGGKNNGYSIDRIQSNDNVFYVLAIRKF